MFLKKGFLQTAALVKGEMVSLVMVCTFLKLIIHGLTFRSPKASLELNEPSQLIGNLCRNLVLSTDIKRYQVLVIK